MKFKTTIILFGIAIVLFAFVYAFELRKPKDEKKSKNIEIALNIPKDKLSKIEITYTVPQNAVLILSKNDNDQWQSQSQSTLESKPIPKATNDTITSALEKNIFDTVKEPGGLDEYGLSKPRVTVMFYFKDGTHRKMMLGSEVPIGNYVYIKEESTSDIYMVPASIIEDFTKLIQQPENEKKQ